MQAQDTMQHCLFFAVMLEDEKKGDSLLAYLLSQNAPASVEDYMQQTALFYAAVKGHLIQLRALLAAGSAANHRDEYYQTPMFYAAREGHTDIIRALVKMEGEVNATDRQGHTPLHYAAKMGHMDAVKLLVDLGASVESQGSYRQTARKWAESAGFPAVATFLARLEAAQRDTRSGKSIKRVKATLMKVSPQGDKTPMTPEEIAEFETQHPDIAQYWQSDKGLEELSKLDSEELLEATRPWEPRGKQLVRKIWKIVGAEIFHEPVDPIKMNLPDYFDVIKAPMDLGTIKKKLFHNAYPTGELMMQDFHTMFTNCKTYNEGDEEVLGMCAHVEESFRTQAEALGLMKYAIENWEFWAGKGNVSKWRDDSGNNRMAKVFREAVPLEERKRETEEIRRRYPTKVPIFLERHPDSMLPEPKKNKFLAPSDNNVGSFLCGLRKKLELSRNESFFAYIDGRELLCGDSLMLALYERKRNEDGFLYMVYREQESVGAL